MNVIKTKTVMVQGFTNKLKQYPSGNMRGTGCCVETSKNDYQSETKTVMVQGEYGEAQITKGKFWNVCGEITDTSKNDYLGNVLVVQRPEDTHRDGPGINQSETKTVMAQRLTNRLSKPTRMKQTMITTKTTRIEIM